MGPGTWILIVVAGVGAGFGVGFGFGKGKSDSSKILREHSQSLDIILDRQTEVAQALSEPITIDAELRAQLSDVPVQCVRSMGGDPMTIQCQWATCLQFGQSSAQRPECSEIRDLLVETYKSQ